MYHWSSHLTIGSKPNWSFPKCNCNFRIYWIVKIVILWVPNWINQCDYIYCFHSELPLHLWNLHCWYFLFQGPSGADGIAGTKGLTVRPLASIKYRFCLDSKCRRRSNEKSVLLNQKSGSDQVKQTKWQTEHTGQKYTNWSGTKNKH